MSDPAEPRPKPRGRRPRTLLRRALLVVLALLAVLLGASCVAVRATARRLVFPGAAWGGAGPADDGALGSRRTEHLAEYKTADGETLRGFYVQASAPGAPILVYFHGNGETAGGSLLLAEALAARGISTFLAEYRGYGGSTGQPSEAGLHADGLAAVEAARSHGADLVIGGWSLGTGVATELARRGHGRGLVLIAPFTSIVEAARAAARVPEFEREARRELGSYAFVYGAGRWALGTPLAWLWIADAFDSRSRIGDVQQPTLVVHAVDDAVVPYAEGAELARVAKKGRLVTLPGGGHGAHFGSSVALDEVVAFVLRRE